MCIKVDPAVQVTLNKRQLGIGYKIVERHKNRSEFPKKTTLQAPLIYFPYQQGKWMQCAPEFRGTDPIENHGFHIYLNKSDAEKTAQNLTCGIAWEEGMLFDKYEIWQVYFKNIRHTGFAVRVTRNIEPVPCVVAEYMLLRKRLQ